MLGSRSGKRNIQKKRQRCPLYKTSNQLGLFSPLIQLLSTEFRLHEYANTHLLIIIDTIRIELAHSRTHTLSQVSLFLNRQL